ncbi:MAG: hypothetical protein EAZ52_01445 [Alphaproteobacteria bacterium]|nr:MAG: hypothetical protein EAZ66_00610 [Alphaproteobacteria bacterium]TAF77225.1 MAG: hypothetical protein EAZ52_01445 [Alphaproteobacteria bacterium]
MTQNILNQQRNSPVCDETPVGKLIAQGLEFALGKHSDKPDIVYKHSLSSADVQKNNRLVYGDGRELEIAPLRAPDNENPIHMGVSAIIPSTPGYFRLLTPMLGIRYLVDGLTSIGFDLFTRENGCLESLVAKPIKESVDLIETVAKNMATNAGKIGGDFATVHANIAQGASYESLTHNIDPKTLQKVQDVLASSGKLGHWEKDLRSLTAQYYAESMLPDPSASSPLPDNISAGNFLAKSKGNFAQSLKDRSDKLESMYNRTFFDSALGALSFGATWYYARRVYEDIHNTYAETVAYELYDENKKDVTITAVDLACSQNKIVKETWDNFVAKNVARVATDIGFFGRAIAHGISAVCEKTNIPVHPVIHYAKNNVRFGDIMLGVKSLMLVSETQRTQTSMLDDLQNLIDHKFNPQHGMGSPVTAGDLFDLYQKYQSVHHPKHVLKDVTHHDREDTAESRQAYRIFSRMADMMNQNYKYKHFSDPAQDPIEHINMQILAKHEYFSLPKFLFLLGHDLIDLTKPERTIALAEVANLYSIQRVKEIVRLEREHPNMPFVDSLEHCPVNVVRTLGSDTSPEFVRMSEVNERVERGIIHTFLDQPYNQEIKELYNKIALHNQHNGAGAHENIAEHMHRIQHLMENAAICTSGQILPAEAQPSLARETPDHHVVEASREPMHTAIAPSARFIR